MNSRTSQVGGLRAELPQSILIVDDDSLLRGLLVQLLDARGYQVESASSALEARTLLKVKSFELVISDQAMETETEGLNLVTEALAGSWCNKALLISGYPRDYHAGTTVSNEIEFLQKPFQIQALLDVVEHCMTPGAPPHQ